MELSSGKLERILGVLGRRERGRLEKFLHSEYFNVREDVRCLLRLLFRRLPEGVPAEEAWAVLYPDQAFDLAAWRHVRSYLLKLVEEFIAIEALRESRSRQNLEWVRFCGTRGLKDLETSALKQARKSLGRDRHRHTRHAQLELDFHELQYNSASQRQRSSRGEIVEWAQALDRHFILGRLQQACSIATQKNVFELDAPLRFLEAALEAAQEQPHRDDSAIQMYWQAYWMLSGASGNAHFEQLNQLLQNHSTLFPDAEIRSLYLMAINFCIRSLNAGEGAFQQRVFDLYQRGLEAGWLFERGQLSPWTFKNIVSVGLKLGEFDTIRSFLRDYEGQLPEEFRPEMPRYCRAELNFALGEYHSVLKTLQFVHIRDPLIDLRSRILQIKAAFELHSASLIDSQLEALRQLLRRRKHLAYHREQYEEFMLWTRRIWALSPQDAQARTELRAAITAKERLVERDWLLAQVRE